jgi:type IV pilus assembly protein PilC
MRHFRYTGRDATGKKVAGVIEAVNEKNALVMLRSMVDVVLGLEEVNVQGTSVTQKDFPDRKMGFWESLTAYNPSLADKAFLVYQIAAMLESGIDIVAAMESLAEEYEDKKARVMLADMAEKMREGESFSEVLARYPKVFSNVFVNVIRAGEESGKLDETLNSLSQQMEDLYKIRSKVISAMAYPVFTLCVAIGVVIIMLVKVLPMFEQIYSGFGAQLPAATRMLINISHFLRDHFIIATVVTVAACMFVAWLWRKPEWRVRMELMIYRIPVFGTLLQEYIYVQTCRILGLLVRSGVHIIDSLRFTSSATPWLKYKYGIDASLDGVSQGESLAELFGRHAVLPRIAARMLAVGEETGRIDDMLEKVASFYNDRVDNKVKMLSSLVEPLLIVALGGLVGLILVAMYMPVFMLGKAMKHH